MDRMSRMPYPCLVAVLLVMVLCPWAARAEGVTIGVILPLSGTHAAIGHMQKNSMMLAMEDINARGGIGGQTLSLDIRDSGGRARKARGVIDHFVQDKQYSVVLGGFSSSLAASLAEKCEQRRLPLIVMTGSEDSITLQDYRYVFRIAPPRTRYPRAAMEYAAARMDRSRAVMITERSAYGDAMARSVKQMAREASWTVVGEWRYDPGTKNLQELMASALETAPDVVFLSAFSPEGPGFVREFREKLPEASIFNLTPASTLAGSYALCGEACQGVLNPSLWQAETLSSASRYRERYRARFQAEPDYHGAQAYASVTVAAQALRTSGAAEPEPVRDALESISVNTVYGRVQFKDWDGYAKQNDPPNYLVRWTGSQFEVVWPE